MDIIWEACSILFKHASQFITGATTIQIVPDLLTACHWAPFERLTF